jgi:hypothetical protein
MASGAALGVSWTPEHGPGDNQSEADGEEKSGDGVYGDAAHGVKHEANTSG